LIRFIGPPYGANCALIWTVVLLQTKMVALESAATVWGVSNALGSVIETYMGKRLGLQYVRLRLDNSCAFYLKN
jgi:hypothetical protein